MKTYHVFLDPGHGGKDPGACQGELKEKNVVLTIAFFTAAYLWQYAIELNKFKISIDFTRIDDEYLSLRQRVIMANVSNARIFVSIHCNACPNHDALGKEIFYYYGSKKGEILAKCIANYLHAATGTEVRGIKPAGFFVLRHTEMPSVLVECDFIDNPNTPLKDVDNLRRTGLAIACGIIDYLSEV